MAGLSERRLLSVLEACPPTQDNQTNNPEPKEVLTAGVRKNLSRTQVSNPDPYSRDFFWGFQLRDLEKAKTPKIKLPPANPDANLETTAQDPHASIPESPAFWPPLYSAQQHN